MKPGHRQRRMWSLTGWLLVCGGTLLAAPVKPPPGGVPSGSERVEQALTQAHADVASASDALHAARESVATRRKPLVERREALEGEVRDLRLAAERLRAQRRQGEHARQQMDTAVRELEAEAGLALAALQEYRRSMETRAGPAQPAEAGVILAQADGLLTAENEYASLGAAAEALLGLASKQNDARLGGTIFAGVCLDGAGREHAGSFAGFGPILYFVAGDGQLAGEVGRRPGRLEPGLSAAAFPEPQAVKSVVAGGEMNLPVDASGGDALRLVESRETLGERLRSGGAIVIPLGIVGLLAAWLTIAKFVAFSRVHPPTPEALNPILDALARGDTAGARAQADAIDAPFGEILREGIAHHTASTENLEEILHERMLGILPSLDRHLGILAVLGSVAPLLGLLGTVGGMIHTFQSISAFGLGDTNLLSSGIAEAMVATQLGLAIAIPVVLIHAYLSRRLRMIVVALEQTVAAFVNRVAAPTHAGSKA